MNAEGLRVDSRGSLQASLRRVFPLSATRLDAAQLYPSVWAAILGGAAFGLVWGVAARIWMRLISTQPEFSITGTAAILVIATVFGAWAGLAFAARRRGWRRWGHYLPRSLVVAFFIPFGGFGGAPLMLTALLVTLAVTRGAAVGLWFLAVVSTLLVVRTDGGFPTPAAAIALASALALTTWKWIAPRWRAAHRLRLVDTWLERIVRTLLLLLATFGFGFVARQVLADKPGLFGALYVLFYSLLLYALFLALRVGLEPRTRRTQVEARDRAVADPELGGPALRGDISR